ncbi:thiamine pyrophosphate-binding protein [Yoonia litorea]|uniref:2-succinyl-5-enolpyruvyl-6-hydroxy-3-cyclohexene-1-carboxylate synthase n=1 Tax=Yoonia litorea TaxID=1123755 RepID=A0A1I6MVT8_9RHOB|nr:thiamine pyrophosphate-binding protein [Yoonia litorea]SFS19747.1 2-succinyl-5-enolpyruvyl-6-hydroxy-3-cyclohexene-1-carboxylate synthase [Yoonia litorea]
MSSYTAEKQAQIVISLLKAHGVRYVIASPGATNLTFVGSIQTDPFFKIFSAVDERSAAYMACGMAEQLGEPVALSCTGATASRNYMPGLTEAFYRKLPVLAITSTQIHARVGQNVAQVVDRSSIPNDVAKVSVHLPVVKDSDDIWECEIKVNKAILELRRHGGGPAHINLPTVYSQDYETKTLPVFRKMDRWTPGDTLPTIAGRIAIFVGSHKKWTADETAAVERFCETNNAAVFCDHTSSYTGKYRLPMALVGAQERLRKTSIKPDISIHIGEVSGDYYTPALTGSEVWRVSPDGELRDTYRKLRHIFEMPEKAFFEGYSHKESSPMEYFASCEEVLNRVRSKVPDLPFSNLWLASKFASQIPQGSVVHFSILNSLRAWNFFDVPTGVSAASNVGGFGIDGCLSSLIGASMADRERLFYLVTGDLAFFYDMNALGSRHIGPNIRILLVNNGQGTEFTQYGHAGSKYKHDAEKYVAASGHFGNQSRNLVRAYAEALGFRYSSASSKEEAAEALKAFFSSKASESPQIVEAFVDAEDESKALQTVKNLAVDVHGQFKTAAKAALGAKSIKLARKIIRHE